MKVFELKTALSIFFILFTSLNCKSRTSTQLSSYNRDGLSPLRKPQFNSDPSAWMKPLVFADLNYEFPCKKSEKHFVNIPNTELLKPEINHLRELANELAKYSPKYFAGRDVNSILCIIVYKAPPTDLFLFIDQATPGVTSNIVIDPFSGYLNFGEIYADKKFRSDELLLKMILAHEMAHFILDHANFFRPVEIPEVELLRSHLIKNRIYKFMDYSVQAFKYLEIPVNNLSDEDYEKIDNLSIEIDAFKNDKFFDSKVQLREILQSFYLDKKLEGMNLAEYLEIEADLVGLKIFTNLKKQHTPEQFINLLGQFLYRPQSGLNRGKYHSQEKCEQAINNGEVLSMSVDRSKHPDPCWRIYYLKKFTNTLTGETRD